MIIVVNELKWKKKIYINDFSYYKEMLYLHVFVYNYK